MSVILDALRRSEAERQRGKAPGLFVEQAARPARRRNAPWLPALAGGAAVALLAAGAFWWMQRSGPAPVPPAQAPAPAPVDMAPSQPPAIAPPSSVVAAPPVPDTTTPEPVVAAPVASPATAPAPPRSAASTQAAPPPPSAPVDVVTPTPPAPALPDEEAAEPALPRLGDLPPEERQALPPLKLSMHVFADDPAQRFVILDDRRQSEGAQPAPGVVIERIRRDGVVLAVNGRRVLLGRP